MLIARKKEGGGIPDIALPLLSMSIYRSLSRIYARSFRAPVLARRRDISIYDAVETRTREHTDNNGK